MFNNKRFAIIAPMAIVASMASAQVTSSSIAGRITDENAEPVVGANIVGFQKVADAMMAQGIF